MAAKLGIDWDAQPLGKMSDADVARRVGCSAKAASLARRQRGITPTRKVTKRLDDLSAAAPFLGKHSDREVARLSGMAFTQARRARLAAGTPTTRIDWSQQPLGSVPDIVLARRHGVCNKVVAQARWKRGIPKWQESRRCPCGGAFIAFHMRQRFCSYKCQRYHWQMVKEGLSAEMADVMIALWAFKKTAKEKDRHGLEELSRLAQRYSGSARKAGGRRDRRGEGAR